MSDLKGIKIGQKTYGFEDEVARNKIIMTKDWKKENDTYIMTDTYNQTVDWAVGDVVILEKSNLGVSDFLAIAKIASFSQVTESGETFWKAILENYQRIYSMNDYNTMVPVKSLPKIYVCDEYCSDDFGNYPIAISHNDSYTQPWNIGDIILFKKNTNTTIEYPANNLNYFAGVGVVSDFYYNTEKNIWIGTCDDMLNNANHDLYSMSEFSYLVSQYAPAGGGGGKIHVSTYWAYGDQTNILTFYDTSETAPAAVDDVMILKQSSFGVSDFLAVAKIATITRETPSGEDPYWSATLKDYQTIYTNDWYQNEFKQIKYGTIEDDISTDANGNTGYLFSRKNILSITPVGLSTPYIITPFYCYEEMEETTYVKFHFENIDGTPVKNETISLDGRDTMIKYSYY